MPVIGTNFLEMNYKRKDVDGNLEAGDLTRNFSIIDVRPKDIPLNSDTSSVLSFRYEYGIIYNLNKPKDTTLGDINIKGEVLFMEEKSVIKKMLAGWKKNKNIDQTVFQEVVMAALNVSQIEALYNSSKVLLPPPFPLPNVNIEGKEEN